MLEFDTGIFSCEVPVGFGVITVAVALPSRDFLDEGVSVRDAAVEALRGQDAEFRFGQVKPAAVFWGVVPFEALNQAAGFRSRKGLIERRRRVGVEIVLNQDDGLGTRKVDVRQVLEYVCIVDGRSTLGHLHVPPPFERREHHEQVGRAVALVFVIEPRRLPFLHRHRRPRFFW